MSACPPWGGGHFFLDTEAEEQGRPTSSPQVPACFFFPNQRGCLRVVLPYRSGAVGRACGRPWEPCSSVQVGVGWGGPEGVSLQPRCVGNLLFAAFCVQEPAEPTGPLPLSLCSVLELINVLTSVRRSPHFWFPGSPAAAMPCFGLVCCTAREHRPGVRADAVPGSLASAALPAHPAVPSCPLPSSRCGGRGQPGSWGPACHLHVNVFEAISGLAIIPTASGDKYSHGLKSPSGRQAGGTYWRVCARGARL